VNVGICLRYQRQDSTLAVLALADFLYQRGMTVTFHTSLRQIPVVRPEWDKSVFNHKRLRFAEWARKQEVVIWANLPDDDPTHAIAQVEWVKRQKIRTIFVYQWHEDAGNWKDLLKKFDFVVAPNAAAKMVLRRRYDYGSPFHVPWAPPRPQQRKLPKKDLSLFRVLIPLTYSQTEFVDQSFFDVCNSLLENPRVGLTILHGRLSSGADVLLKRMSRQVRGRLDLVRFASYTDQLLALAAHDVTVFPVAQEIFGLMPYLSVRSGTPVVAPNNPPINQLLTDGEDGILFEGRLKDNCGHIPTVKVDPQLVADSVMLLSNNVRVLNHLQNGCGATAVKSEQLFKKRWLDLLSEREPLC